MTIPASSFYTVYIIPANFSNQRSARFFMHIGKTFLPHGLMLGPMAGYSDYAMRCIARENGAEYTVSEMVSAKALCYHDKKTPLLARVRAEEMPMAVQIFGADPGAMAEGAAMVAEGMAGGVMPSAIDINMGCPVPKIVGNGEGSALMTKPALVREIVAAVCRAVRIPVTVKIRSGFDDTHKNAVEIAALAEEAGAAAVTVHARTRKQYYAGKADLSVIADVKRALTVPVVGNGDILSADDAVRMKEVTGCDGLMVARGAIGNPALFREIICRFDGAPYTPPTREEKIETAMKQLRLSIADKGEYIAVRECRKQLLHYISRLRGAAEIRARIALAETPEEVEAALTDSLLLAEQS